MVSSLWAFLSFCVLAFFGFHFLGKVLFFSYLVSSFQTIQISINMQFKCRTVLFQAIQFNISMQFKCRNTPTSSNSV